MAASTLSATADALRDQPRAILVCHAASHVGVINDVVAVGQLVRDISPQTWFVVDGCQSVGQIEVDAHAIGCDFLVGTGRKWLRGPRGTAFLYAGERALGALPDPLDSNSGILDEHGQVLAAAGIRRYEPWELSWSAAMGLGAAAEYLLGLGPADVHRRIASVADHARAALGDLPGVTVHDRGRLSGGIVSFSHDRVPAADVATAARANGINVGVVAPSVAPLERPVGALPPMVRVSPHVYNDVTDVDHLVAVVSGL